MATSSTLLVVLVLLLSLFAGACSPSPASPTTPAATTPPVATTPTAPPTTPSSPATTPAPTTPKPTATATPAPTATAAVPKPANPELILATTTSTADTGLLDAILPMFEKKTGYKVKPIAVGSGQAMTMGERGEADVLLVHSPDAELKFIQNGHGINRRLVMHNDFIIIGPSGDPAVIKGAKSAIEALTYIAGSRAIFISRGDNSGTDALEKKLWKTAVIDPKGQTWYQETGQGMGATLNVAAEKRAYTITDRGTYLKTRKNLNLDILVEGDKVLLNVYHVIEVNPQKSDKINAAGAKAFSDFIVSTEIQEFIGKFGVDAYGLPLFFPDAGKPE
ncbi:MAG: substrate-binding domain-containing protein [Dehalococcoidales bacterium]|nr:substrate-binding domain-containing protein [Dehalococcoidales bacterium]